MTQPKFDNVSDLMFEVPRGTIAASCVLKFGRNVDVDTGGIEDIWDTGGSWVGPTTAQLHNIRSTSASDAAAGAGARTLQVFGLDPDYEPLNETITLNGTTNVQTTGCYIRIFRMAVLTAGSGIWNQGNITACAPTDDTVTAQVSASFNQTLMAIYTVPANVTAYMTNYYGSMNRNNTTGAADLFLKVQSFGGALQTKHVMGMVGAGTSQVEHHFGHPFTISEKSDIRMQADVSADNTDVSAGFDLVLVNEN